MITGDETDWNRIRLSARDLISAPEELAARRREDRASHDVSESVLPRALEIVRALAEEAGRNGFRLAVIKMLVKDVGDLADAAEQARIEQQRAHEELMANIRKADEEHGTLADRAAPRRTARAAARQ